ncbi:MAG: glycosyltransferase family 2 protein [Bacteroidales bacterium]|nr:glycosyltransferase family 2 protein [Bacteroidales bacterium]
MNKPLVSIVIVNYNAGTYLQACIKSLKTYGIQQMEIILVDNHSCDGSLIMVEKNYPDLIVIRNDKNLGFPAANNQGFSIAKGKYIFMLNPDAEVTPNAISNMLEFMEQNPLVGLLAPRTINQQQIPVQNIWHQPTLWSTLLNLWHIGFLLPRHNYQINNQQTIFEIEAASGAAMFFRKSLLEQVQGLDETLFWIEDIDFCKRILQAGFQIVYFPFATVIHHVSVTARKNYRVSISNQIFSKVKFFKKHHSSLAVAFVYTQCWLHVLAKIGWFSFLAPFSSIARKKLDAYIYTLSRLHRIPQKFESLE